MKARTIGTRSSKALGRPQPPGPHPSGPQLSGPQPGLEPDHPASAAIPPKWRLAAASPAIAGLLCLGMAASSTPIPDRDVAESLAIRMIEGGSGPASSDLAARFAAMDPAERALALSQDASWRQAASLGLLSGWRPVPSDTGFPSGFGATGERARKLNAAVPPVPGALRAARPFVMASASAPDRARAMRCLTLGIYYEAALESDEGQAAVAQVILNRVRDPNYPASVCGVVFEGAERTTGCQFSFTCDGSMSQPPVGWAWERAGRVAERALSGHVATRVGTATHYHADYVYPWWSPTLTKITQIGAHIFYRWKGGAGESAAFRQRHAGREPIVDEARFSSPRLQMASGEADGDSLTVSAGGVDTGELRTVEIGGQTRVVGVVSLGGRRQPTPQEIAAINERLRAFEASRIAPAPAPGATVTRPEPPSGVTPMDVEEVGLPAS